MSANIPIINPSYNDPTASFVMISSDGVLFRIHEFVIRAASSYINDILTSRHISNGPGNEAVDASPFPLNMSSDAVKFFLDMMSNKATPPPSRTRLMPGYFDFVPAVEICDELGCPIVKDRIFKTLVDCQGYDCFWELFTLASHHGEKEVARSMIRLFWQEDGGPQDLDIRRMCLDMAKEPELSYLLGYFRARARARPVSGERVEEYWARVAGAFEPYK